jgi:hypothetical protein
VWGRSREHLEVIILFVIVVFAAHDSFAASVTASTSVATASAASAADAGCF